MADRDLADGATCEMKGSGAKPYVLRNTGGVYSCTCPAWRNQSVAIESRTCKHLRKLRGDAAEKERIGTPLPGKPKSAKKDGPPLLLAHAWDNTTDLTDWWMSEKLDGVRAYWTGAKFLSRLGNEFHAPDWFVEGLPETSLDGELWIDRGAFQRTVSIVRRQDKSEHWQSVRFLVFDAPEISGPFEDRLEFLAREFAEGVHGYTAAVANERCRGESHLREQLTAIEAAGGEGLMLREPGSAYEVGRSMTLLKVKSFHDAEATVVDHSAGKGKHKGRLGALVVQLADGTEFSVGTGLSDALRAEPPEIGSTITFRYQEMTDGGVPRFPSFLRVADAAPKPVTRTGTNSRKTAPTTVDRSGFDYFELRGEKSEKFWEVQVAGTEVTVRYGRVGTNGQTKTKSLASGNAAQKHRDDLVKKKTAKGYTAATRPTDSPGGD